MFQTINNKNFSVAYLDENKLVVSLSAKKSNFSKLFQYSNARVL